MKKQKSIIYIGDFDLRNENVQAHLVRNNAKIFNHLGYIVAFIGVNREATNEEIQSLPILCVGDKNMFLELENTLSVSGLLCYQRTVKTILAFMDLVAQETDVRFVISYQSPTYALVLDKVIRWCWKKGAKYIVNSADITSFKSQPMLRRLVMSFNWKYLHRINKSNADGLIAVSRYIERFYHRVGMPSIVIPPLFDNYSDDSFELADTITFVYAGSPFVLKKNVKTVGMKDRLDKIIDLCLKLSTEKTLYRLVVIGITKDMYITCVPRHKVALDTNNDILFAGKYSHNDTLRAVRNADYMINLRDVNIMNEAGLSTKLVESVSLGTPVVMNSVGDTFLYLREGITGFRLSGDLESDVLIMKSLCNKSYEERITMKQACSGDKVFAIERYEPKFDAFLREVSAYSE